VNGGYGKLLIAICQLLATILHMAFRATAPAFSKKTKTPPPEETGMESAYLKALGEKQTPVAVKLLSGEVFRGWIEYYDLAMIRLTRESGPNLFIFKHEIMYIAEDNGRRPR
jgi:host factor-I protein